MRPEEKQWWRDKNTKDHKEAVDRWHQEQLKQKPWASAGANKDVKQNPGAKKGGGCFIATAACGDYNAPEVIYLSAFRDESLSKSALGRSFIRAYYAVSPRFATVIEGSDFLRLAVRKFFLRPLIFLLRQVHQRGRQSRS